LAEDNPTDDLIPAGTVPPKRSHRDAGRLLIAARRPRDERRAEGLPAALPYGRASEPFTRVFASPTSPAAMEVAMPASSVVLALCLTLLSGCSAPMSSSSPSALPDFTTAKGRCELDGGFWHTNIGICELL
jgi:hypothetical protein